MIPLQSILHSRGLNKNGHFLKDELINWLGAEWFPFSQSPEFSRTVSMKSRQIECFLVKGMA